MWAHVPSVKVVSSTSCTVVITVVPVPSMMITKSNAILELDIVSEGDRIHECRSESLILCKNVSHPSWIYLSLYCCPCVLWQECGHGRTCGCMWCHTLSGIMLRQMVGYAWSLTNPKFPWGFPLPNLQRSESLWHFLYVLECLSKSPLIIITCHQLFLLCVYRLLRNCTAAAKPYFCLISTSDLPTENYSKNSRNLERWSLSKTQKNPENVSSNSKLQNLTLYILALFPIAFLVLQLLLLCMISFPMS